MELKPGAFADEVGLVAVHRGPADLASGGGRHGAAERAGEQLAAEADAEHGHPEVDGVTQPRDLGHEPVADALVVPRAPGGTKRHEHVVVRRGGEGSHDVGGRKVGLGNDEVRGNVKAVLRESLADRPEWAHVIVLDEKNAHQASPSSRPIVYYLV